MKDKLLVTSGFDFENYTIIDYLDFCSGESALGVSTYGNFVNELSDAFTVNNTMYTEKMEKTKEIAIENLKHAAQSLGANAIIGVTLNYSTFSSDKSADTIVATASGTAVIIESIKSKRKICSQLVISNYNPDLDFRATVLSILLSGSNDYSFALKLSGNSANSLSAINADIILTTLFGEEFIFDNVMFSNSDTVLSSFEWRSPTLVRQIPLEALPFIKSSKVIIKKYIIDNTLKIATDNDLVWIAPEEPSVPCPTPEKFNVKEYITSISLLSSAVEILDYTQKVNDANNHSLSPELIDVISSCATLERMYGNSKDSCIKKIKAYFSFD